MAFWINLSVIVGEGLCEFLYTGNVPYMKRIVTITVLAAGILSACGTTTIIREVAATTTTEVTVPAVNKYDQYYEHVLNNSGKANTMGKDKVIEIGDLICGALDKGNGMDAIVTVLTRASTGQQDNELFAAEMYGAVKYLCPEYQAQMDAYLASNT